MIPRRSLFSLLGTFFLSSNDIKEKSLGLTISGEGKEFFFSLDNSADYLPIEFIDWNFISKYYRGNVNYWEIYPDRLNLCVLNESKEKDFEFFRDFVDSKWEVKLHGHPIGTYMITMMGINSADLKRIYHIEFRRQFS